MRDGERLPVTGAEPAYRPEMWNNAAVQPSHNCFSYALNMIEPKSVQRCGAAQDGHLLLPGVKPPVPEEYRRRRHERFQCNIMHPLLSEQLQKAGFHAVPRRQACPEGFYKVAFTVSSGDNYHWYRMDPDGYWSHKDGGMPASRVDASGKPITDPAAADRRYSNIHYDAFCGYYCVRNQQRLDRSEVMVKR